MDGLPRLNEHDLKADLQEAYRRPRRHHLFAYYGVGDETFVELNQIGRIHIVPVRSELELREKMPPLSDADAHMAFLVPWTEDLPLDLAGRFALGGRVKRIGKEARLRHLFGVGEIDGDALRSPLADFLLRPDHEGAHYPVGDPRLTLDVMWGAWLRHDLGFDVRALSDLSLDLLLAWTASRPSGAKFIASLQAADALKVRDDLAARLEDRLGPAGPMVWSAWEKGQGTAALELALLFEALAHSEDMGIRMWVKNLVRSSLEGCEEDQILNVAVALGRSAAGAVRALERSSAHEGSERRVRELSAAAETRVNDKEVFAALRASTRLAAGWTIRLAELGRALAAGAREPSTSAVEAATERFAQLQGHVFFKDAEQKPVLERGEMAIRLLSWLVARTDQRIDPGQTPYGSVEALGRWYAEEGGYVDWARRWARGNAESEFGAGVQAVVEAADALRTDLDRQFASGLAAWVEAGQPNKRVVPIHTAVERVAARFLSEREDRRMLVLLMDGMAWAQCVELLESLGNRAAPWGPLSWHETKSGRIGESMLPVMLAGLPTVTEVSRSSFFAGKPMSHGAPLSTAKDPERWQTHAAVKKFESGSRAPRLLLRSEGHTKAGSASAEALSLVADPERRVVGVVLNAIDDSLKASHAVRHPWRVENIASLPDLLDAAREHGRVVMLASDHGHVPADRLERVRAPHPGAGVTGGGSRWRPWESSDAAVADNEVAIPGSNSIYAPKGAYGIVMLADDASCYQGNTHAGEHGGATLAEVVAPCLLVGCDEGPVASTGDPALRVRSAFVPDWWHFDVRGFVADAAEAGHAGAQPPKQRTKVKKTQDERQLTLLPEAGPANQGAEAEPGSGFANSVVLKELVKSVSRRKEIVSAVEVLLRNDGALSSKAFADTLGLFEWRVPGHVAKLAETLNLDGYQVIRLVPSSSQIHLDKEKLAQLFEVRL